MPGLTDDHWKIFNKIDDIMKAAGHTIMLAGGAVRDHLMEIPPEDLDFATTATPDEIMTAFRKRGHRVIPTGIKHGTVTVIINKIPIEITTLRVDKKTDGRHAEVEWTTDFRLDAARRDLTINSMFMDRDGNIHDYFGGQQDLKFLMIRFVGNPEERIREDYLRILRYFRFFSRYEGANIDPSTMHAIAKLSPGLRNISGERIWTELNKIFVGPNRLLAIKFMHDNYVFDHISNDLKYDNDAVHKIRMLNGNPRVRSSLYFFAPMIKSMDALQRLRGRLKFDNNSFNILSRLICRNYTNMSVEKARENILKGDNIELMYHEAVYDWNTPLCQFLDEYRRNPPKKFPVSGHDVKAMGYEGPEIGQILDMLRSEWAKTACKATKKELLEMIRDDH